MVELTPGAPYSDADQYKYGKNRVEADAKRLQSKEEELLKRKEALRNRLAQLRKERKDLRAAIEVNAGRGLGSDGLCTCVHWSSRCHSAYPQTHESWLPL